MSTPINQLPITNAQTNAQNDQPDENQLVSEILKEINDNDTNQISMKEPPSIPVNENNLNDVPEISQDIPIQNIQPDQINSPEMIPTIESDMPHNFNQMIDSNLKELNLLDKIKKYSIEALSLIHI